MDPSAVIKRNRDFKIYKLISICFTMSFCYKKNLKIYDAVSLDCSFAHLKCTY